MVGRSSPNTANRSTRVLPALHYVWVKVQVKVFSKSIRLSQYVISDNIHEIVVVRSGSITTGELDQSSSAQGLRMFAPKTFEMILQASKTQKIPELFDLSLPLLSYAFRSLDISCPLYEPRSG